MLTTYGVLFGCFGRNIDGFRFLVFLPGGEKSSTREIHLFGLKGHLWLTDPLSCSVAPIRFPFFGGCPTKHGLPQKGLPFFFSGSLSNRAQD